jgi:ABC-type transport system involved in multi-copper enzyme maturation permease subunit
MFQQLIERLKAIIIVIGLFLGGIIVPAVAHAQEINPTPGTYSYGSTSEFSPYATLSQGSNSGGSLAPTGQNMLVGIVIVVILLLTASALTYYLLKSKKARQLNQQ